MGKRTLLTRVIEHYSEGSANINHKGREHLIRGKIKVFTGKWYHYSQGYEIINHSKENISFEGEKRGGACNMLHEMECYNSM